ncbi:hypothetical protein Lal_00001779 [Lupinus albus]|uniref:Putative premnaspirodiene oxygenase n=1 Tax=Lupinus albus TaxID=3870 RepID=A0A6A4PRE3_LUPAL|nr:putative premnaspirodiene oxygenase [Lupinus albus]KAF1893322.1 hypothetical protein Lal_00001779 [Lupinus albus]
MDLQNPSTLCFVSFLFLFLLFKLVKTSSSKNSKTKLPPGPWKLPLIGNIHQFVGAMPHHRLRDLASKYGPIMHLKLGEVHNIVVTSPEIAYEVMKTNDINFANRPDCLFARLFSYNATDIEFSPYGDYWRQLRKICTIELLSSKRVQSFRSIREEEMSKMVKKISESERSIVNLSEMITKTTYGTTARIAIGEKYTNQKVLISTIEEAISISGELWIGDMFPSSRIIQFMGKGKAIKLENLHSETDQILQDIINNHKNKKSSDGNVAEDLVDVLLKFQQDKDSQTPLINDNIKAIIQEMVSAGGETTSSVVVWAMSEIMKNQEVMKQAQAEIRKVYGSKGFVDESELHQLTYLKAVIKEALRLHPPVPLLMPRENRESCKINEYDIPAKSKVMINVWAIGRDSKYWTDAESFKPERFLNTSFDFRGTDFQFLPFGSGRRICPGITFATPNLELALAQLLYHFDWKLPNEMKSEEIDMTESIGMSVKKKNDLCLIPIIHVS